MKLFDVYPRYDITPIKGEGSYVYDQAGQAYLDLYGGHGVISIGHSHPHYIQKIEEQLRQLSFYSNSVNIPGQTTLAKKLGEASSYKAHQLFLCSSGTEANENAIKVASFHTGRKKVVAFHNSFHGRTAAALNITDNPKLSAPVNIHNFPVTFVDINNEEQLLQALKGDDVCAVIIEGIQGLGGLDAPEPEYLRFVADQCKNHGTMLILDEIQSGYGRSGKFFAHQHAGIEADIITIAKGMGNGFPIAGVLIDPDIRPYHGMLGTTFGGNHLGCAAAIAVLEIINNEDLIENVGQVSTIILEDLLTLDNIKRIKGKGLMLGVELHYPVKEIRAQLLHDYHIFTGASANPNLLRILPPLNVTADQLKPFITALKELL